MNWKNISGTLLIVHTKAQPDEGEWVAFIRDATAMAGRFERAIVFADVALSADQRRQVTELHKAANTRAIAIITSSSLTRMVVTALSWMNRAHRAFDPTEVGAAFDFLELDDASRVELQATALRFARELNHMRLAESLVQR